MRTAFLYLLLLLPVLAALPAEAQSTRNYGSVYSRFGVGERVDFSSSQSSMMGGAGVALRSGAYTNLANPALWSDLSLVTLSVGAEVQGLRAEDALGQESRLTAGGLTGLQVSVPLYANRLGVTLAFQPYSRVHYAVAREELQMEPQIPGDTLAYRVNLEGSGGLQQVRLGMGWRPSRALSFGASLDGIFGVVDDRQRTVYLQPADLGETLITRRTRLWGVSATVGAVGSMAGLLGERDALSVGASLSLPTRLEARRTRTTGLSLDQDTLRTPVSGNVTLPLRVAAGFGYRPDSRWTLAADVLYEPWSAFESDFAFGGYAPDGAVDDLRDRLRVGGGLEFLPAGTDRSAGYLARAAYRFGGYLDQAFYAPAGEGVTTLALTGGISLPGLLPGARFDLGLETGTRGTIDAGLVRDLFIKGTATINFGERWFIRRQLG